MAMGIPLVTNNGVGDVETIVERYHSGIVIEEFTEAEFTRASLEIAQGQTYDKAGIRQGAKAFYSLDAAVEKYISIYNRILQ